MKTKKKLLTKKILASLEIDANQIFLQQETQIPSSS